MSEFLSVQEEADREHKEQEKPLLYSIMAVIGDPRQTQIWMQTQPFEIQPQKIFLKARIAFLLYFSARSPLEC